jgi:predicted ATPase
MRAAAEDAPNWSDGAWIAWLRDISGSSSLEEMLAQALGIPITNQDQASFQLKAFLREKELLLLLDNFERVKNGAGLVKSLLFYAPQIKIIITSRARLGIRGEQVVEVRGLSYPRDYELDSNEVFQDTLEVTLEEWSQRDSALELFVENARRVSPKFQLSQQNIREVIRICQLVDGFPLGLELAAGWTSVFPCGEIVRRIEQNVDFLKARHRDVPPRQASIRAVFEYSWGLLSEEERALLEKLAVFPGAFSTEAALNIAGARPAPMASLCDKFVLRIHSKERFEIHPLLRSYAAEKLDQKASLAREIKDLHSSYYLAWLKDCTALLQKAGRMLVTQPSQQSINLGDLEDELGNLCQAWQWAAMNDRLEDLRRSVEGLTYLYTLSSTPQADKGAVQTAAVQTAIEHLFSLLDTKLCQQLPDSEQLADLRHTLRWLLVTQSDFYTAESHTVPVEEDSYLVKQVPSQTCPESMDTSTGMPIYSIFS